MTEKNINFAIMVLAFVTAIVLQIMKWPVPAILDVLAGFYLRHIMGENNKTGG